MSSTTTNERVAPSDGRTLALAIDVWDVVDGLQFADGGSSGKAKRAEILPSGSRTRHPVRGLPFNSAVRCARQSFSLCPEAGQAVQHLDHGLASAVSLTRFHFVRPLPHFVGAEEDDPSGPHLSQSTHMR
jgi:hypothetical protein